MKYGKWLLLILLLCSGAYAFNKFYGFKNLFTHTEITTVRDTVIVRDTIWVPRTVVKWVHAKADTVTIVKQEETNAYSVRTSKIDDGDTVDVRYISPVMLSPEGFFDITLRRAPKETIIDSIYVNQTVTKTVYHPDLAWCIVSAAVGAGVGILIGTHSGGR